ncbi:hypothetical protein H5410_042302 [Solanum commersonii]|uniref:Uncharacterized protein n=1 Tax=Solanum commersonii TaxID=4109 RepID=A0A9J5XX85_SOLCO|nr:hypothetical protein H5410_042302 [Solanum commersonii]
MRSRKKSILPRKIIKNGKGRKLKEKKEGLKEGKARKGFINLNANMTSQILATNVEDLAIMQGIGNQIQDIAAKKNPLQVKISKSSEEDCLPCQQGLECDKEGEEEDDIYKIYSQFKEWSINVIDNDKIIELLQTVKDPEIRAQIIDKISNTTSTSKNHITEEIPTKDGSYTMAKVKNLLLERRKLISSLTTINDLKQEIDNLKEDIRHLKEKNVIIEVRLDSFETRKNLINNSASSSFYEGESNNLDFLKNLNFGNTKGDFLQSLKAFTSQKFYTKSRF